jgi:hypothetical protein
MLVGIHLCFLFTVESPGQQFHAMDNGHTLPGNEASDSLRKITAIHLVGSKNRPIAAVNQRPLVHHGNPSLPRKQNSLRNNQTR